MMRRMNGRTVALAGVVAIVVFVSAVSAAGRASEADAPQCGKDDPACAALVAYHFPGLAAEISHVRKSVGEHKKTARQLSRNVFWFEQRLTWAILITGFLTTCAAAVARSYHELTIAGRRIDIALIPVILAAFTTLLSGVQNYYRFDSALAVHRTAAHDLAVLQDDVEYGLKGAIREAAAGGDEPALEPEDVKAWRDRLAEILSLYRPREPGDDQGADES